MTAREREGAAPRADALGAALERLAAGGDLSEEEASAAMAEIMAGAASPARIAAFVMALRVKGETASEIAGCARAMRRRALPFPHPFGDLVDTCGTGGDGAGTFNISTTAAFIVAGAGPRVAKHGNRAISSRTGSADVLEELGVRADLAPAQARAALAEVGITFLFAPTFHAAMRHAAPVRHELGLRTVFNVLGPLCNPAGASAQLVGVYDVSLVTTLAEVLGRLGSRRALVVHGEDGLDELSTAAPNRVAEWDGERVRSYTLDAADLGVPRSRPGDLAGGDALENARLLRRVLEGEPGPRRDAALLNAAGALVAAGAAKEIRAGLELARRSVDGGAALAKLDGLAAFSRRQPPAGSGGAGGIAVAAAAPGWGAS